MLGMRLDAALEARLNALAEKTHRSKSYLTKEALLRYIEQEETKEFEKQETLAHWEKYQETGEVVSNDDMMAWLDSWGTDQEKPCPVKQSQYKDRHFKNNPNFIYQSIGGNMNSNRNVYDSNVIPQNFKYPRSYIEYLAKSFDIYPWKLIDTESRVGIMRLERVVRDGKQLVPFAILELGDGDTACFNGTDLSGDPSVEMLILDGSNRSYSFLNFNDWLKSAKDDAEKWNK